MDWLANIILPSGPVEVDSETMERLRKEYEKLAEENPAHD
jgi:hypothetical protein